MFVDVSSMMHDKPFICVVTMCIIWRYGLDYTGRKKVLGCQQIFFILMEEAMLGK